MIEITDKDIEEINRKCVNYGAYEEGIFVQPYGIPSDIKEPVIYSRWRSGGREGGSCYGHEAEQFSESRPKDVMKVLDILLEFKCPDISFLKYRKITALIRSNEKTSWEYYGNCDDWVIEYIPITELVRELNS